MKSNFGVGDFDSTHQIASKVVKKTAVKLMFIGELAKQAISEGNKALSKYTSNKS